MFPQTKVVRGGDVVLFVICKDVFTIVAEVFVIKNISVCFLRNICYNGKVYKEEEKCIRMFTLKNPSVDRRRL